MTFCNMVPFGVAVFKKGAGCETPARSLSGRDKERHLTAGTKVSDSPEELVCAPASLDHLIQNNLHLCLSL